MPKQDTRNKNGLLFYLFAMLVLSMSLINILSFYQKSPSQKVLGMSSDRKDVSFWENFLAYNPNYLPGWKELLKISYDEKDGGLYNKSLKQISRLDPNFKE